MPLNFAFLVDNHLRASMFLGSIAWILLAVSLA
jgi:hypothetical protein